MYSICITAHLVHGNASYNKLNSMLEQVSNLSVLEAQSKVCWFLSVTCVPLEYLRMFTDGIGLD